VNPATRWSVAAGLLALLALVGAGAFLIDAYIEEERQRDLLQWESRLGLVADAKADAIFRAVATRNRELDELAGNASLRFYLWQLAQARDVKPGQAEPGALGYLRNLLLAAAERFGYAAAAGARLPANLPQPRTAGLAVLDAGLRPVVATPGLAGVAETYREVAARALAAPQSRGATLMLDADDRPVVVAAVAIGSVPGTGTAEPLGVLLGVLAADAEIYPLLQRGPAFAEDNEALLLGRRGAEVLLLSPTRDGSAPLRRTLPADRADLAEARAVTAPGRFVAASNYRGEAVLQVSRPVRGQDWVLAQQIDAGQALALADERRRFLLAALSLLLVAIVAVAVAAWRHGSGVRARHQAEELADKAARLQRQTDLLHTVTDNVDSATALVTAAGRVLFTNQAMAAAAGATIAGMLDGPLAGFLPAPAVEELQKGLAVARERRATVHRLLRLPMAAGTRSYNASFIPVERIGEERDLVLLVLGDVTDLQQAQQRRVDVLRRLVLTLVSAVDRHDPYSAHHARRMTEVADALARELAFGDDERSAITLAASLANIGKIMIPVEVLTKPTPLTEEERALLQKHVEFSLELLRGLEFEGRIADIIAQKQERPDGRGYPRGLAGERITLAGQVLAVANAFVALVSPRAYRPGLPVKAALDELVRVAGSQFDRRVVAALYHCAENRADWSRWGLGTPGT
jgi:HD-GYP domain-containing protein (c-di-GMP phosphodiesterase class II)